MRIVGKLAENHSIILILLLLGAAGSYYYGFTQGVFGFLVLGVLLEIAFWVGLLEPDDD
ncbi:hypothetical protein [Lacimicrobium sp. SS2-24]|uniref:hypothetical protein n=1 Tax=Lacimicrobium sp. SS2-24 TaxID=2005569 RepID=UPI001AEF7EF4|nr:hypothetical protein [Lacimicrobium sp. SS2-24]